MGNQVLSSLFSSQSESDTQEQPYRSLSSLLDHNNNEMDWEAVRQSLAFCPEQSFLYAHGVEDSVAVRVILKGGPVDVLQTILSHDEDACHRLSSRHGRTILHTAAQAASFNQGDINRDDHLNTYSYRNQIIDFLLHFCPDQVTSTDLNGCLPLHLSIDPITTTQLRQAYPDGVLCRTAANGNVPLHEILLLSGNRRPPLLQYTKLLRALTFTENSKHKIYSSQKEKIRMIELVKKSLWIRNKEGTTPFWLLRSQILEKTNTSNSAAATKVSSSLLQPQPQPQETSASLLIDDEEIFQLWQVLAMWIYMLRPDTPQLHAHIEMGACANEVLMRHALDTFPMDIHQRDALGRTPLHIVGRFGQQCDNAAAIAVLLQANPRAPRMTDLEGRLPIDLAAESPHISSHTFSLLIQGEPRAVHTRDLRNGYYPFITSAFSPHATLDTTYYLLRSRPEVLSYYHTP